MKDLKDIPIYPELRRKTEKEMQDKSNGMYYLSLEVTEQLNEVKKWVVEKDIKCILVHEFYKGKYNSPIERYQ